MGAQNDVPARGQRGTLQTDEYEVEGELLFQMLLAASLDGDPTSFSTIHTKINKAKVNILKKLKNTLGGFQYNVGWKYTTNLILVLL